MSDGARLPPWVLACVFLASAALLTPLCLDGINVFDEGFIASGAMMMRRGAVPLRDFFVIYGPGGYGLQAALFGLFGEDLFVMRCAHVLQLGWVVTLTAACAGRLAGTRRVAWALASGTFATAMIANGLPSAGYPAVPATGLALCTALALARWAGSGAARWLVVASLLAGATSVMRWDFGLFALIAMALSAALARPPATRLLSAWLLALGPATALVAVTLVPLVVSAGAGRWFTEVPMFLLREFATWRGIDFIAPTVEAVQGGFTDGNRAQVIRGLTALLFAATPFALIALALPQAWSRRFISSDAASRERQALAWMLALLAAGLLNQMRVRPGWPQGYASFCCALPLAAYVGAGEGSFWRWRGLAGKSTASLIATVCLLLPLYGMQQGLRQSFEATYSPAILQRATGVRLPVQRARPTHWRDYEKLIAYVREHTQPNERIFSGVQDTSLLFVNDAMLYFLCERAPATRWIEMEPGLSNSAAGQHEIINELERHQVSLLVLLRSESHERNRTGRSNGIALLDSYVATRFTVVNTFGNYKVARRTISPDAPRRFGGT